MKNYLLIFTVGILMACNGKKEATEIPPQQIEVIEVVKQDVPIYSELVGQIYGYKDIPIRARVDGFLNKLSFQEGSRVTKGQLLYGIDSEPFDADVAARESRVAEAKTMMVNAKNELDRYKPLAEINAVSQSDLDAAQANYDASISTVNAAQANLDAALINQGYCKIYAPINGIIGKTEARVGEYVGKEPNPVILTTVSRIDTVRVQFSISEAKYLQIAKEYAALHPEEDQSSGRRDYKVEVELLLADNSTYQHKGKIDFINNVIDPNTGSLLVQASFANPEFLLRPGLYAKVRIQLDVEKYFSDLREFKSLVWLSDSASSQQLDMLKDVQWRKLNLPSVKDTVELSTTQANGFKWVLFRTRFQDQYVVAAVSDAAFNMRFNAIMNARDSILNSMWPLLLLYIALCTLILTAWVTRSLKNLQFRFKQIELKRGGVLLSEDEFDMEFASFVRYFNDLIEGIRFNFEQASRFSSDAAHELRTPLTVIHGNLKRLINKATDNSTEQMQLSLLLDEVERLISITNKLVMLSQADGNNFKLDLQAIKLHDLVGVIGEDIQSLMPSIKFEANVPHKIKVLADPNLFQQLLNNLISNAVKYSPPNGTIFFKAEVSDDMVEFSLANHTFLSMS